MVVRFKKKKNLKENVMQTHLTEQNRKKTFIIYWINFFQNEEKESNKGQRIIFILFNNEISHIIETSEKHLTKEEKT